MKIDFFHYSEWSQDASEYVLERAGCNPTQLECKQIGILNVFLK